jgi:hypothetical protein
MTISARPSAVAVDASSLITFFGPPNTPVEWAVSGNGTLQPIHVQTDENGVAVARLEPSGSVGDVITVTVRYLD